MIINPITFGGGNTGSLTTAYAERSGTGKIKDNQATYIASSAFLGSYGWSNVLEEVEFKECVSIYDNAFMSCSTLTKASFPKCTSMGSSCFAYCYNLSEITLGYSSISTMFWFANAIYNPSIYSDSYVDITVNIPNCSYIGSFAFSNALQLVHVNAPLCEYIGDLAFNICKKLTSISFPLCSYIGSHAFYACGITSASFSLPTIINEGTFERAYSMETISMPNVTEIKSMAFYSCYNLTSFYLPNVQIMGSSAFKNCSALTQISMSKLFSIPSFAFLNCYSLQEAHFDIISSIASGAFENCYNLISLYLMSTSVCVLRNGSCFTSTPIDGYSASAGRYGNIYVPASLLSSYQTAIYWSVLSSRFVGI